MSITKDGDLFIYECDKCNRPPEDYMGDDFMAALAQAKADGWRAWKDRTGTWCHSCPECNR